MGEEGLLWFKLLLAEAGVRPEEAAEEGVSKEPHSASAPSEPFPTITTEAEGSPGFENSPEFEETKFASSEGRLDAVDAC